MINPEAPIKSTDRKTIENILFLGFLNSMNKLIMAPIATTIKIMSLTTSIMNNAPFNYLIVLYRNSSCDWFVGMRFKVILNKLIFYTKVRLRKKTAYIVIVYLVEAVVDQIK